MKTPDPGPLPPWLVQLRTIREQAGLRQPDLARLLHIEPMTLSHWESGRRLAGLAKIQRWARTLGYDLEITLKPHAPPDQQDGQER